MTPPINQKHVRSLIGLVNCYRDMWAKLSRLLQPLIALTSKQVNFKWTSFEKNIFDEIEQISTPDALIIYPDFNKRSDVHTDAS